jgi:hypothetical protein
MRHRCVDDDGDGGGGDSEEPITRAATFSFSSSLSSSDEPLDVSMSMSLSTKRGRQYIEGYARDGDLSVDKCARHEPDGNRTQDIRFIQVQAVSMT